MTDRWEIIPPDGASQQGGRWEIIAPTPRREDQTGSRVAALLSGAADTASFGFGDEAVGALFGEEAMRESRLRQARLRADHPVSFGAGQIGGALVGGGGLGVAGRAAVGGARTLRNVNWAGRAGLSALSGGTGYSAYGAGSAGDGGRLEAARDNFIPGAVMGGGFSLLGSAAGPVLSRMWRGRTPDRAAADLLAQGITREGGETTITQRLADHASMGRGGMMLDAMGESGEQLAMGAANRPSAGRSMLRDALETRGQAIGPRAQQEMADLIGPGYQHAGEAMRGLRDVQRAQALPLYAQAWRDIGRVDPQDMQTAVGETMRRHPALFRPAERYARELSLAETGREIADQSDPRYWHYMLQGVQRELGARLRAGYLGEIRGYQGAQISTYTRAARQFNDQVRRALGPSFRKAQDTYSGAASAQDAIEMGYDDIFRQNLNSLQLSNIMERFRRMTPGDRQHVRAALVNRLQDEVASADTGTGKADVLRRVMGTEGRRRIIQTVLGERQTADLLRRFDYDRAQLQTGLNTGIRTNSHTAPILSAENYIRETTLTPATSRGSWFERIFGPELRRAAEARNEQVSDELLSMLAMPADDALTALRTGAQLGTRGGLLSRAQRYAREQESFRRRAALNAATGFYAGVGGEPLADYVMGGSSY